LILFGFFYALGFSEVVQGLGFLAGGPIWLGVGVYLSSMCKAALPTPGVARSDVLRTLQQYQVAAEPVTLLGVAPSHPLSADDTEASLKWIRDVCRAYRSDGDTVAGQSVEAVFRSPADAAAAARAVQEGWAQRAAEQPETPSLRCGLATGCNLERARAEAAGLLQAAEPGDILTDADSCGAALPVLDHLVELPGKVAGGTVYSWRASRP
jgi:class 3 adenylate cyclase